MRTKLRRTHVIFFVCACTAALLNFTAPVAQGGPVLDDIINYALIDQEALDDSAILEVTQDKPVGQTFVTGPSVAEIYRITVHFDQSLEKWGDGESVTLTIWDSPAKGAKMASYSLDSVTVRNDLKCNPVYLRCKSSPNTRCYLEITHNGKGDGKAEIRASTKDSYPAGAALIGGVQQQTDLWFKLIVKNAADHDKLMERMFSALRLDVPGMEKVKDAVQARDWDAAVKATVARWDSKSLTEFHDPAYVRKPDPAADLTSADALMENRYKTKEWDFSLGERPNWWADPIPGKKSPAEDLSNWKLPSFVARAYLVTGNEKYAIKANELFDQFMLDNPPPTGQNVEFFNEAYAGLQIIRKMGWLAWYYYGEVMTSANLTLDTRMAYIHYQGELAKCAFSEIGTNGKGWVGNWGFQIYTTLFNCGIGHPEYVDSAKWVQFSMGKLIRLSRGSVLPDGVLAEAAPGYHEMCAIRLKTLLEGCSEHNLEAPKDLTDILGKMYTFTMHLTQPDGNTPMFGDSDRGDYRDNLKQVSTLLKRPDMLYVATQGKEGAPPAERSVEFKDSGYYFMRASDPSDAYEDARYMGIHNGNWYGTHGHHDRLAPIVYAYGRPLLVDPGRFEYSKAHDWYWPSLAHNVITLEGRNYDWKYYAHKGAVYTNWSTQESIDFFDGRCQPHDATFIDRQILFVKPFYWVVTDQVRTDVNERHKAEQRWHFTPSEVTLDTKTQIASTGFASGGNLQMIPVETSGQTVRQEEGKVAFVNAVEEKAPVIIVERDQETPIVYTTILRPYNGSRPDGVFRVKRIGRPADVDTTALEIETSRGKDYIFISHGKDGKPSNISAGDMRCQAKAVCVTLSKKGNLERLSWVDGREATLGDKSLATSSKALHELDIRRNGTTMFVDVSAVEPTLEVYVGKASAVVVNGGKPVSLKRGTNYFRPFGTN